MAERTGTEERTVQDMRTHRTRTEFKNSLKEDIKRRADPETAYAQREGTVTAEVGTPDNPSTDILTVSNCITLGRFLLTLVFLYLFAVEGHRIEALWCYAIAALTDFLDGYIARTTHTVSWLGKICDPIMDRVLLFTGVLALVLTGELPVWVAVFVIGRDAYLLVFALMLQRYRRRPVDVIYLGKVTTALFMVGFCDMLLGSPVVSGFNIATVQWLPGLNGEPVTLGMFVIYLAIVCSSHTASIYTWIGYHIWEDSKQIVSDDRLSAEQDSL